MVGEIGTLLIGLSLAVALYTAYAAWRGIHLSAAPVTAALGKTWLHSAQNATNALTALLGVALLMLLLAFLTDHFEISYVAQHSSTVIPVYLKISAVWAGQEGSLLLWCFLQALFAALATGRASERARPLVPWATVFLSLTTAFFVAVTFFLSQPFTLLPQVPLEGRGLNPLLRHPGMIFHPPALYVGYVGLAVPFAFAMAALITRQIKEWTAAIRTWTLIAWLGLGLGLLLGMRWAYDVLGWGGYWGWDPVENAGLLPWFTATALLHGAVMQEEKRGFHVWNMLMVVFSFALVLFGTFATRSGMIQSVHAYAVSNLGGYFLTAIAVTVVGSLALLYTRRAALKDASATVENLLSRDGMFFLTLALFCTLTLSVLVGSLLPTLTEVFAGQRFEAGPAWFDRVTGPQFAVLILVIGLCPLLGRGVAALKRLRQLRWVVIGGAVVVPVVAALAGFTDVFSLIGFAISGFAGAATLAEFVDGVITRRKRTNEAPLNALWHLLRLQRRKYGGYLVHLGVILMALGIIGTRMYPFEVQTTVNAGQATTVQGYTLIFEELKSDFVADYNTTWANVSVYRGATYLTTLQPRLNRYTGTEQTITVPALHPDLREDLYLILSGWTSDGATATFKVVINALVNFLWLGGLIFLAGGGLALWPRMENRTWNGVALIVGLVLLLGAGWAMWGMSHGSVNYGGGRPLVGQDAPDFRLSLLDGETVSLKSLRGQIAVVNFWATWCPSCVDEMPDLQEAWEAYRGRGVTFLGVAYQDSETTVRSALVQYDTTYPVGLDTGDRIAKQYGITGIPETFIVAPDGRVAYVHVGPITAAALSAQLDSLLK
jgi:cytochrome c-type biogenesis protein CcmF